MTTTITLEEAQARLAELIGTLALGDELVITRDDRPIARLTGLPSERPKRELGRCKGMLIVNAEDDEHLKDWAEYMP